MLFNSLYLGSILAIAGYKQWGESTTTNRATTTHDYILNKEDNEEETHGQWSDLFHPSFFLHLIAFYALSNARGESTVSTREKKGEKKNHGEPDVTIRILWNRQTMYLMNQLNSAYPTLTLKLCRKLVRTHPIQTQCM
jgi:hypothetical protein